MAQEVEHFLGKEEVTSSNLVISSIEKDTFVWVSFSMELGVRLLRRLGCISNQIKDTNALVSFSFINPPTALWKSSRRCFR